MDYKRFSWEKLSRADGSLSVHFFYHLAVFLPILLLLVEGEGLFAFICSLLLFVNSRQINQLAERTDKRSLPKPLKRPFAFTGELTQFEATAVALNRNFNDITKGNPYRLLQIIESHLKMNFQNLSWLPRADGLPLYHSPTDSYCQCSYLYRITLPFEFLLSRS
jgi:hypothetical protein